MKNIHVCLPIHTDCLIGFCRQKRAKAEASKLRKIQSELKELDQLLSIDVRIIRDRIEEASREYLDAQ